MSGTEPAHDRVNWLSLSKDLLVPLAVVVVSILGWKITESKNKADIELAKLNAGIAEQNAKTADRTLEAAVAKNHDDTNAAASNLAATLARNASDAQTAAQNERIAGLTLKATRARNRSDQQIAQESFKATQLRSSTDETLQKAALVKELAPLVTDSKYDMAVRAQTLISLIETGAISDLSAFSLADRLLHSGLIRSDYPRMLMWNRHHPLLESLLTRMPGAMKVFLDQFMVSRVRSEGGFASNSSADSYYDAVDFWCELFYRAIERAGRSKLAVFNDNDFLSEYLPAMESMVGGSRHGSEVGKFWLRRQEKGLRIVASLREVGDVGYDQHARNLAFLLKLIAQPDLETRSLRLADTLIQIQTEKRWAYEGLFAECLNKMLTCDDDMRHNPMAFNLSDAADGYISWYAGVRYRKVDPLPPDDLAVRSQRTQTLIARALNLYLDRIRSTSIKQGDFGPITKRSSIARPLIEALLSNIEASGQLSVGAKTSLDHAFSLGEERIRILLFADLRERWMAIRDQSPRHPLRKKTHP